MTSVGGCSQIQSFTSNYTIFKSVNEISVEGGYKINKQLITIPHEEQGCIYKELVPGNINAASTKHSSLNSLTLLVTGIIK